MVPESLSLHVLLAAPRPAECEPAPSRARVEALYDTAEAFGDRVTAEWLWPPTVAALVSRLRRPNQPAVDALYVDAVAVWRPDGLELRFEDAGGNLSICDVHGLGARLRKRGVRVVILAVTAAQEGDATSAVTPAAAVEDVAAAVGLPVVWLSESLSAEQVGRAMTPFFAALLTGQPVDEAVRQARLGLGGRRLVPTREERDAIGFSMAAPQAPAEQTSGGADEKRTRRRRRPQPTAAEPAWRRLSGSCEAGGLPPEADHGFSGRARDLGALERALRTDRGNGLVLLHGPEGIGKTTLAAHAARWLMRTGRFGQVVYSDLAGGGHAESALYDLGVRLLGEDFAPGEGAEEAIVQALAVTPTLVIWDGLEALLGGETAADLATDSESLSALLSLGARLARAGASRLCAISEQPGLPNPAYGEVGGATVIRLGGLAKSDAQDLLLRLRQRADPELPGWARDDAGVLADALGGHPQSLCILPALYRGRTPAQIMANLGLVRSSMDGGEAAPGLGDFTPDVVLEATLRILDADFGGELNGLAYFAGGCMDPLVPSIAGLKEEMWRVGKKRLASYGLLREDPLPGFDTSLIRCARALTRRMSDRLPDERCQSVARLYRVGYVTLADWVIENEQRAPAQSKTLARRELPNFRRALSLFLVSDELDAAVDYACSLERILGMLGFSHEREAVGQRVQSVTREATPDHGPLARGGVRLLIKRGGELLADGCVPEAVATLESLSARMVAEGGLSYGGSEAVFDRGITLHRLGRALQAAGEFEAALLAYDSAASALSGLDRNEEIARVLIAVCEDLGRGRQARGQLELAEDAFRQGLAVATEWGEPQALGTMNNLLGAVLIERGDLVQATTYSGEAIIHCRAAYDPIGEATAWDQVATCAWRADDLVQAEECLVRALELVREAASVPRQVQLLTRLSQLAEQAGHASDAEACYEQLIRLAADQDLQLTRVTSEISLAQLLLAQGRVQNAKAHAEAARQAVEEQGPDAKPWYVYALLGDIAASEGDEEALGRWWARAQESYAASAEAEDTLVSWRPFIEHVAKACGGDTLPREAVEMLEKLGAAEDWHELADTVRRILDGERGEELWTSLDLVDGLVVRSILHAIEDGAW